jgi:hypothetical protein
MLYVRTKLRKREAKLSRGIMFHTVSICQHLSASVSRATRSMNRRSVDSVDSVNDRMDRMDRMDEELTE